MKEYSTIKFVLHEDLNTESVKDILDLIARLESYSKEFYMEEAQGFPKIEALSSAEAKYRNTIEELWHQILISKSEDVLNGIKTIISTLYTEEKIKKEHYEELMCSVDEKIRYKNFFLESFGFDGEAEWLVYSIGRLLYEEKDVMLPNIFDDSDRFVTSVYKYKGNGHRETLRFFVSSNVKKAYCERINDDDAEEIYMIKEHLARAYYYRYVYDQK